MTVPTTAECKAINAFKATLSRASAAAGNSADGFQGIIETVDLNFESAAGNQNHRSNVFVSAIPPTTTDFPNAKIGDKVKVYKVDSTKSPTLWDYDEYVYTITGFTRIDGVNVADVTLTTAQVKALNGTPITCIAAPGTGKTILVEKVLGFLDYNSAAYDGIAAGEDLTLKYTNGSGVVITTLETTGWLDQTADTFQVGVPAAGIPAANAAVVAHMATGEIATGNSPVKLRIWYRVVDLNF